MKIEVISFFSTSHIKAIRIELPLQQMRVSESSNRVPNKRPFRSLSLILPAKLPVSLSQRLCVGFFCSLVSLLPSLTFILRLSWVSLVTF